MKPARKAVAFRLAVAIAAFVGTLPANSQTEIFICADSNRNPVLLGTPCLGTRQPANITNPDTRIAPLGTGSFTNDATGQTTYLDARSRGPATVYQPQKADPYVPGVAGFVKSTLKLGQAIGAEKWKETWDANQAARSAKLQQELILHGPASETSSGNTSYTSNGMTYTRSGNTTYRSDGTTYIYSGNTTNASDGTISTRSGNTTYYSDGTTYTHSGSTTIASDGTTYTRSGNTTYFSNGTTCTHSGNTTYCQ
jgi:hypothetical protein